MFRILKAALLVVALVASSATSHAHEGHDHGAEAPQVPTTSQARLALTSDTLELVAVGRDDTLVIYLDRFETNAPVLDATIEIDGPGGPVTAVLEGDAYRAPAAWLAKPGAHDLIFTVTTADGADVLLGAIQGRPAAASVAAPAPNLLARLRAADPALAVGAGLAFLLGVAAMAAVSGRRRTAGVVALIAVASTLLIGAQARAHEGHDHGAKESPPSTGASIAHREVDGAVFAPKEMQRLLAFRTAKTTSSRHAHSFELPGRVIPDPSASGYAQASVSGRLSPPEGGFPRLGAVVRKGDILAYVSGPLTAAEQSDQRQRQGELEQQAAIVEQRIERFERLLTSGAVARVQLDEARLELKGLRDRRLSLDSMRRQPEALVAPVDGVIAAANAVAGQIAETNAIVFHIVDPARLWIEARTFERLGSVAAASARSVDGKSYPLVFAGAGLSDRTQALPVHFSVAGDASGLRVGQLLTVVIQTENAVVGVALPRSAVVQAANGQTLVYEHTQPERFEPRYVRVAPLDAQRVLIASGLEPGRRVVTQGAELLNQVR